MLKENKEKYSEYNENLCEYIPPIKGYYSVNGKILSSEESVNKYKGNIKNENINIEE